MAILSGKEAEKKQMMFSTQNEMIFLSEENDKLWKDTRMRPMYLQDSRFVLANDRCSTEL